MHSVMGLRRAILGDGDDVQPFFSACAVLARGESVELQPPLDQLQQVVSRCVGVECQSPLCFLYHLLVLVSLLIMLPSALLWCAAFRTR